jgi:hypothetical protein
MKLIKSSIVAIAIVAMLFVFCWPVQSQQFPPLRISEADGSPNVFGVRQIKFPNGSVSNASGVVTVSFTGAGALTATNPTDHGVLLGNGDQTVNVTAVGTTGTVLHGNTGADPTFSAVDLTADVTGILPPANGGITSITTADQGGFWGAWVGYEVGNIAGGTIISANNQVRVWQFVLPFRCVVGHITFRLTTGIASSLTDIGIYSADGNTKLVSTGAIDTSGAAADKTTPVGPVTLNPGVYYFAWTSNDATVQLYRHGSDTTQIPLMNTGTAKRIGTAANSSSSGVLPSSLGTITAANVNFPMAYFER